MKTAGAILREARVYQSQTLEQIASHTRIKEKFLSALESSDWSNLPNFSIAQGFARSYAQSVNVDPKIVSALLRRDFPQTTHSSNRPEISLNQVSLWTPQATIIAVVGITFLVLGVYLIRQYILLAAPPSIVLEGLVNKEQTVWLSGQTNPSATVLVNGKPVILESNGKFAIEIDKRDLLDSEIKIEATSRTGKKTIETREIE